MRGDRGPCEEDAVKASSYGRCQVLNLAVRGCGDIGPWAVAADAAPRYC